MLNQLLLVVVLTLLNGFFASAEMAFVTLEESDLSKFKKMTRRNHLKEIMKQPTNFLATIQVGITLAGFFSSATVAVSVSEPVGKILNEVNIPYPEQVAIVLVTIVLSYFVLVFGELVPKRIALSSPIATAKLTIEPVIFIMKIFKPFVWVLSKSTLLFVKLLNLKEEEETVTEENIKLLVKRGREKGTINPVEEEMIHNVFDFDETLVYQVMTPVEDIFAMDVETFDENEFFNSYYTRVPIRKDGEYIGILHLKDYVNKRKTKLEEIIRPLLVVNKEHPIDVLFLEMQRLNEQMRLVMNEHDQFVGVVTFEDLVEEVFGPIYDEYSVQYIESIEEVKENVFRMSGKLRIDTFNDRFGTKLYSEKLFTMGEYLKEKIGILPRNIDHFCIQLEELEFEIVTVRHKEIITIEYKKGDYDVQA